MWDLKTDDNFVLPRPPGFGLSNENITSMDFCYEKNILAASTNAGYIYMWKYSSTHRYVSRHKFYLNSSHSVWKSQKKSHSTLRVKRAMLTFWRDKSKLKMSKIVHFGEFLKIWSLRSNSITRQVTFNRTKIGRKRQNYNFWVIFKQCAFLLLS